MKRRTLRGPSGLAKLANTKRGINVTFIEGQNRGQQYQVFHEDLDDWISAMPSGDYYITMNQDATTIYRLIPPDGSYVVKYAGLVHRDDELPAPYMAEERSGKNERGSWKIPAHPAFRVKMEIATGKYERGILTHELAYCFQQSLEDGGFTDLVGFGSKNMADFLGHVGFDFSEDDIRYSENVLPALDKLLATKNKLFIATVKDGWVKDFGEVPEGFTLPARKKATAE